ncbi:hypothetical protein PZB75_31965 (plasmid) [Streptomyces sp. AM 4-1-1]|uniref:hypothetical protein n=1 Tax=Streptomyces sp. AM 4-1-1 TaxID=3028710 RepID=UPI0023B9BAC8|nr:hypothetical protein [Streptomyces sp. AM 4-1-1]WEH38015.1 hypothetical protein PZB75_31965 [Streptomyces sp. AM 4-1-1]
MTDSKITELLARAASGDAEAAAAFVRARALRLYAAGHVSASGRAAARRMLRRAS